MVREIPKGGYLRIVMFFDIFFEMGDISIVNAFFNRIRIDAFVIFQQQETFMKRVCFSLWFVSANQPFDVTRQHGFFKGKRNGFRLKGLFSVSSVTFPMRL